MEEKKGWMCGKKTTRGGANARGQATPQTTGRIQVSTFRPQRKVVDTNELYSIWPHFLLLAKLVKTRPPTVDNCATLVVTPYHHQHHSTVDTASPHSATTTSIIREQGVGGARKAGWHFKTHCPVIRHTSDVGVATADGIRDVVVIDLGVIDGQLVRNLVDGGQIYRRGGHGSWCAYSFSQPRERDIYIYIYTHTYTYTHSPRTCPHTRTHGGMWATQSPTT